MELTCARKDNILLEAEVLVGEIVLSSESKRAYRRAIRELIDWCEHRRETTLDKGVVYRYRSYLISQKYAPATINQKLSGIRALAIELGDTGRLPTTTAAAISSIRGVKTRGVRLGRWLSAADAERLLAIPDRSTLKGKRDCALLAVATGCGLRRTEIADLMVETMQQRSGRWVLIDIRGKHGRIRSVPMPQGAKDVVDQWLWAACITSGRVFRAISKNGRVHGHGMSAQAVYEIIRGYGIDLGVAIAPHDLRRSFARLARSGNSPLEQIQLSLGHASIATTEKYVGANQDLQDAPCDRLGITFGPPVAVISTCSETEDTDEFLLIFTASHVRSFPATGFMPVMATA